MISMISDLESDGVSTIFGAGNSDSGGSKLMKQIGYPISIAALSLTLIIFTLVSELRKVSPAIENTHLLVMKNVFKVNVSEPGPVSAIRRGSLSNPAIRGCLSSKSVNRCEVLCAHGNKNVQAQFLRNFFCC